VQGSSRGLLSCGGSTMLEEGDSSITRTASTWCVALC
jgi:hypothetical protein